MCGIIGIIGTKGKETGALLERGLFALQHRGQQGGRIAVFNKKKAILQYGDKGLVGEIFNTDIVSKLKGYAGLGQVRYNTTGDDTAENIPPLTGHFDSGSALENIALVYNGNATNIIRGFRRSDSDTEEILYNFSKANPLLKLHIRVFRAFENNNGAIKGGFACIFMHQEKNGDISLIAVRDPNGIRPLCLGTLPDKKQYVVASESCALDAIGATFLRFVRPGEIVTLNKDGLRSFRPQAWQNKERKFCVFELVYLMHPSSYTETADGKIKYVQEVQENIGARLAVENSAWAKKVLPKCTVAGVPNSSLRHATGFARQSNSRREDVILRNTYTGRTFIEISAIREPKVRRKFSYLPALVFGDVLIIIDDSLVRGTTSKDLIKTLRAKIEAHRKLCGERNISKLILLIASPPVCFGCYYGVDTPNPMLLAWNKFRGDKDALAREIKVDYLEYITFEGLVGAIQESTGYKPENHCTACLDGKYPVPIENEEYKIQISKVSKN